jgi:hypothetical protein
VQQSHAVHLRVGEIDVDEASAPSVRGFSDGSNELTMWTRTPPRRR